MNRCFELSSQLTAAQKGSVALPVLSLSSAVRPVTTFADLAQQTYLQITICSSSGGLVFCQIGESNQFIEGSNEPELQAHVEGDLHERASLPQAVAVSCRFPHHVLRADARKLIFSCGSQEELVLPY